MFFDVFSGYNLQFVVINRPKKSSLIPIVRTTLGDFEISVYDPVNDPVAVVDSAAPVAAQIACQRFRLPDSLVSVPFDVLD